jgi:hypothetical protein
MHALESVKLAHQLMKDLFALCQIYLKKIESKENRNFHNSLFHQDQSENSHSLSVGGIGGVSIQHNPANISQMSSHSLHVNV